MLARAAARSLRSYSPQVQIVLPHSFSRSYAKHSKPKRPNDYRLPPNDLHPVRHGPNVQRPLGPVAADARPDLAASTSESNHDSAKSTPPNTIESEAISDQNLDASHISEEPASPAPNSIEPNANVEFSKSQEESEAQQPEPPNLRNLPDLSRGIPPTIDAEMAEGSVAGRSDLKWLKVVQDPSKTSTGGRGDGEFPKIAYISSIERRTNRLARYMYASLLGLSIAGTIYLGRNWDNEEEERNHPDTPSGWGFGLFYHRANARVRDILDYYNEPSFTKLLPNPDPLWERPYTLVLSLDDLLIHSEWSREHGWRMAKRPGVDYFLRYLHQYYELVIFTSVPSMVGDPILRKLDPFRVVMWPLFREATRFQKGVYIKDLSFLNRDLKRVIMMDTVAAHAKLQPENAVILPKWKGDLQDKDLISYIPFLEYVATMDFEDTRQVLKSFEGKHIPTEFARREAIARERFQKELAEDKAKRPRHSGVGLLGSVLGLKPMGGGFDGMDQGFARGFDEGKTYQDLVREHGQRVYELFEKDIRENSEKWLKEMAAEEEKMKEETMKGVKMSVLGAIGIGGGGT